jgi:hypothetical protein
MNSSFGSESAPLLGLLNRLTSLDITWRRSPNGALIQHDGRMLAMLLVWGNLLTVSPKDGEDRQFELSTEDDSAVEFIRCLLTPCETVDVLA